MSIEETLKPIVDHPYIVGGVVLVGGLLYLYFSASGSSSSSGAIYSGGPDDADVQAAAQLQGLQTQANLQASTNAQSYNLQSQEITASQEVADSQTAADVHLQEQQIQVEAGLIGAQEYSAQQQYGSQVAIAQLQASSSVQLQQLTSQAAVDIDASNNGTAFNIAQLQAHSADIQSNDTYEAQLAALAANVAVDENHDNASVQIAGLQLQGLENSNLTASNIASLTTSSADFVALQQYNAAAAVTAGQVSVAQINSTTQLGIANDELLATNTTVAGEVQLGLAQTAAQQAVLTDYINTAGTVATTGYNDYTTLVTQQQALEGTALTELGEGVFNKGGEGGANQVSAISSIFGETAGIVAGQQAGASETKSNSAAETSIITGLTGVLGSIGSGIFGSGSSGSSGGSSSSGSSGTSGGSSSSGSSGTPSGLQV